MEFLGFLPFLFVAILILRKPMVALQRKIRWVLLLAGVAIFPGVLVIAISSISHSVYLMILNPFLFVFSAASPWIVYAIFNDKTKEEETV